MVTSDPLSLGEARRLAASVDTVLLLRDFLAWEPRPLLRKRAQAVLARLEEALASRETEVA